MMIQLAIADKDEQYLKALSAYLHLSQKADFRINCFTRSDSLYQFISEPSAHLDILLVTPDLFKSDCPAGQGISVILLVGDSINKAFDDSILVNKYQSADDIAEAIIAAAMLSHPDCAEKGIDKRSTQLVSVYSPAGGVGKTTLAIALSTMSASMGYRSLYISMEHVQSTAVFFEQKSKLTMSHIFYYIKERRSDMILQMANACAMGEVDGLYYFSPFDNPFEWEEIDVNDISFFLELLVKMGRFDYIYLDMSSGLDNRGITALGQCSMVFLTSSDLLSAEKCQIFLDYVQSKKDPVLDRVMTKMIRVSNKTVGSDESLAERKSDTENDTPHGNDVKLPWEGMLYQINDGRMAISLENPFGQAIKDIVQEFIINRG